jgi:splicing factor 3B subunit 1
MGHCRSGSDAEAGRRHDAHAPPRISLGPRVDADARGGRPLGPGDAEPRRQQVGRHAFLRDPGGRTDARRQLRRGTPLQGGYDTPGPKWTGGAAYVPDFGAAAEDDMAGLTPRAARLVREGIYRNRFLTDEDIESMLPPGYDIVPVPAEHEALYAARRREAEEKAQSAKARLDAPQDVGENLPALRPEDTKIFELLLRYRHIQNDSDLPPDVAKSVMILRCLLRVKNGDTKQRKVGYRTVSEKAKYFGAELLFHHIFNLWMSDLLDEAEKHAIVKLIDRALFRLGDLVIPHVAQILTLVQPLLSDPDPFTREEGREVTANLARAAGLKPIVIALKRDIQDQNEDIRQLTARTMAIVAQTLGVKPMVAFIHAVCRSQGSEHSTLTRHTGLKIITEIALLLGASVRKDCQALLAAVAPCLGDQQVRVKIQAAQAVAALAEACYPHGIEEFLVVLAPIREECRTNRGKVLGSFLRAMGCLIALMQPADAMEHGRAMADTLVRGFSSVDEELRRVVLRVVQQLAQHKGVTREFLEQSVSAQFFAAFWSVRLAIDRRTARQLIETTVDLAKRIGAAAVLFYLVDRLKDRESDHFQKITLEAIQRVVEKVGTIDVSADLLNRLVESVFDCLHMDDTGMAHAALHGVVAVAKSLEGRMAPYAPQLVGLVTTRINHSVPTVRRQAAELIGRAATAITASGQEHLLQGVTAVLVERLNNEIDADALAANVKALRLVFEALSSPANMRPSLTETLQQLVPIVKNPNEDVQENVIELIGSMARAANAWPQVSDSALRVKFFQLAMDGLFYLLKSKRKRTRVVTAETFGEIATAITPIPIVKQLLNNLKKDDRTERICTEVALAVVAKRCRAFVVVPFLINEFRLAQSTELAEKTQHAVLKALRFLFEYLGTEAARYAYSVLPLLEWSLTEKSLQYRRMACEVVRHMALCLVGQDQEDLLLHLLNLIHPNLIETTVGSEQVRLTTAVTEVFEAARLSVNPAYLLRMLEQGMWHPARKVREGYWRIYNTVYLGCGEALVPAYAPIPDEGVNTYSRECLEYIV